MNVLLLCGSYKAPQSKPSNAPRRDSSNLYGNKARTNGFFYITRGSSIPVGRHSNTFRNDLGNNIIALLLPVPENIVSKKGQQTHFPPQCIGHLQPASGDVSESSLAQVLSELVGVWRTRKGTCSE
jgi:hypothetical protein